jgi:hypothetical protein
MSDYSKSLGVKSYIEPSATHFISREGTSMFGIPVFKVRTKSGEVVDCAKVDGIYYKVRPTTIAIETPVPFLVSSRVKR